jgi:hypothetical protein
MAQFTVTVNPKVNLPPNQIGFNTIPIPDPDTLLTITQANLTTETSPAYSDPEGDAPLKLKVTILSQYSPLKLNGVNVVLNQEITFADIAANKLTYLANPNISPYQDYFGFDIADIGSGLYSGLTQDGRIYLDAGAKLNLPPSEVGDGSADMEYQGTLVFTPAMFTTLTTPPYSDPEGDQPEYLKILSLPAEPGMKLNGVDVTVNQVIPFTDIAAGLLTYTNDDPLDTNGDLQTFTFSIADTGSGQFVE